MYARPLAPEFDSGKPYDPFKLDILQLGKSFSDIKSTISSIDEVVEAMTCTDSEIRLCANEALEKLQNVINSIAPRTLLVEPVPIR
ncbi:hypothetical protein BDZ94DRAFT_1327147 [Collybia nuda]|uniref:Uncharacterized protein n=1 Tax=Collybia nuda TaxID=64659 RepID=A0A9P5XT11_9AGAR|nr:hypothetical protein BDZ94DRAFT_1327147 [Collybia nuda]